MAAEKERIASPAPLPVSGNDAPTIQQEKLEPAVQDYIRMLAEQQPFTKELKVDPQNVIPALASFWPDLPEWSAQAYETWARIEDVIHSIKMPPHESMLLHIAVAPSQLMPAPLQESMETGAMATFDAISGIEHTLVFAPNERTPSLEGLKVPAGLMIICQPVPITHDEGPGLGAGTGAFGETAFFSSRNRDRLLKGDEPTPEDWKTNLAGLPFHISGPVAAEASKIFGSDHLSSGMVAGSTLTTSMLQNILTRKRQLERTRSAEDIPEETIEGLPLPAAAAIPLAMAATTPAAPERRIQPHERRTYPHERRASEDRMDYAGSDYTGTTNLPPAELARLGRYAAATESELTANVPNELTANLQFPLVPIRPVNYEVEETVSEIEQMQMGAPVSPFAPPLSAVQRAMTVEQALEQRAPLLPAEEAVPAGSPAPAANVTTQPTEQTALPIGVAATLPAAVFAAGQIQPATTNAASNVTAQPATVTQSPAQAAAQPALNPAPIPAAANISVPQPGGATPSPVTQPGTFAAQENVVPPAPTTTPYVPASTQPQIAEPVPANRDNIPLQQATGLPEAPRPIQPAPAPESARTLAETTGQRVGQEQAIQRAPQLQESQIAPQTQPAEVVRNIASREAESLPAGIREEVRYQTTSQPSLPIERAEITGAPAGIRDTRAPELRETSAVRAEPLAARERDIPGTVERRAQEQDTRRTRELYEQENRRRDQAARDLRDFDERTRRQTEGYRTVARDDQSREGIGYLAAYPRSSPENRMGAPAQRHEPQQEVAANFRQQPTGTTGVRHDLHGDQQRPFLQDAVYHLPANEPDSAVAQQIRRSLYHRILAPQPTDPELPHVRWGRNLGAAVQNLSQNRLSGLASIFGLARRQPAPPTAQEHDAVRAEMTAEKIRERAAETAEAAAASAHHHPHVPAPKPEEPSPGE